MNLRGFAPLCLPCLVLSAGEVREEILVVVNAHVITRRTFQQAVEQGTAALYREFSGKALDDKLRMARENTLQGMIDSYLITDKAADLGISISDENLRSYVDDLKRQNNFTSDADFERALKGSLGIGLQAYLARSKQEMLKNEVLRREVYSRIAVDEPELLAYYQEHRADYKQPSRFRIRELVLPRGSTPEEQQATADKLAAIQAELKKGTPFEDLAARESDAPSRSTGGDLGWLDKGRAAPGPRVRGAGAQSGAGLGADHHRPGRIPGAAGRGAAGPGQAVQRGARRDPGKAPGAQGPECHRKLPPGPAHPGQHPVQVPKDSILKG